MRGAGRRALSAIQTVMELAGKGLTQLAIAAQIGIDLDTDSLSSQ
jgi:hypothetical protein